MPAEYEFQKKPHRMTSPPANNGIYWPGYSGVGCKLETDPVRTAILCREATWGSVYDFEITPEIAKSTLAEIAGGRVLGAAFETPALAFVMRGSRSTMDQLLRLRESAGASHTTRDNDFRDFNVIVPTMIDRLCDHPAKGDSRLWDDVDNLLSEMRSVYGRLVDAGVPPQDARYVALPMGYQGDWVQVMNMRALIKECEQRLCNGQTQHESNYMVRLQRDLVVTKWPHMDKLLRSSCEKRNQCTSGTMLFPPCGAFGQFPSEDGPQQIMQTPQNTPYEISVVQYDPEKHLYPPDANAAMEFAEWDAERKELENEFPNAIYSMAGPPQRIGKHA